MSRGIIYTIINKQNGYKYIGNTTLAMNKEWVYHMDKSKRMSPEPLHKAFRQHGTHNFMIKELDECDESEFESKTNYWIEKYNPEYNVIIKKEVIEVVKEVIKEPKPKQSKIKPWGSLTDKNRGNGKHSGVKIRGKNLSTGICTDYENARMAALSLTGDPNKNGNILLAAKKGGTAYGHKWQLLEEKSKKKPVFGVNKKTEQIELRYESIADAVRSISPGTKSTGLIKSLKNPGRYSWKGCWWFYS
jgi:group I intron endonuclease